MDGPQRKRRVLIVDDTPKNIQVCAHILSGESCEIAAATCGAQALAAAAEFQPDLVLLDVMMPDMDGYAVCAALQKGEATSGVPVIFLTAKVEPEDVVRGFESGAADYVAKPFNAAELLARVRTQLRLKAAMDAEKSLVAELRRSLEMNRTLAISLFDLIRVMRDVLAEVSPRLSAHAQNVAELANKVAAELGLPDEARQTVVAAALLHAVGLMGAPEELFRRPPCQLAGEARELYMKAPEAAADLFRHIPALKPVCDLIVAHRENVDGSGPMGMDGDALPVEAKILRVCEYYDAAVWLRGEDSQETIAQMNRRAGALFDRECLRAFIKVISRRVGILPVPIADLRPGMKLARNLVSPAGRTLVSAGTTLSALNLKRIRAYHEATPLEDAYVFAEDGAFS